MAHKSGVKFPQQTLHSLGGATAPTYFIKVSQQEKYTETPYTVVLKKSITDLKTFV